MAEDEKKEKKIIVDEDWKVEAQHEKEILAAEEDAQRQEKPMAQTPQLPPADFAGLVSMLTTQAFFALGVIREEKGKEREPDLGLAKYNIDLIDIIQQKTKGNLTEDEVKMLESTLHQLRMVFVKVSDGAGQQ